VIRYFCDVCQKQIIRNGINKVQIEAVTGPWSIRVEMACNSCFKKIEAFIKYLQKESLEK